MKRASLIVAVGVVLALTPEARAATPFEPLQEARDAKPNEAPILSPDCLAEIPGDHAHESEFPGYFNGIGAPCRYWEARTQSTLDTNRVFTQTLDLARALRITNYLKAVIRLRTGVSMLANQGLVAFDGPIVSLGIRQISFTGNHAFEIGLRLIPNWSGPNNNDPLMQQLAFGASTSSSLADDALWLPLANFGSQLYLEYESRSHPMVTKPATFLVGLKWLARGSIVPMQVATWLGPQSAFIGNVALDFFFGLPTVAETALNLQAGIHGEISISSIWPGTALFPGLFDGFVGWSPKTWFAFRAFAGGGGSPLAPERATTHFGGRLEFYVP